MAAHSLVASLLVLSHAGYSAVYTWTDERGQTHFSEVPPARDSVTRVSPSPVSSIDPGTPELQRELEAFQTRREVRDAQRAQETESRAQAELRAANCTAARDNLKALNDHGRVRLQTASGTRYLTTEERAARISAARDRIAGYCAPAARSSR